MINKFDKTLVILIILTWVLAPFYYAYSRSKLDKIKDGVYFVTNDNIRVRMESVDFTDNRQSNLCFLFVLSHVPGFGCTAVSKIYRIMAQQSISPEEFLSLPEPEMRASTFSTLKSFPSTFPDPEI